MESRSPQQPVRSEKNGPVTTVILDRPHARNAIDRASADALAQAFRDFEADPEARVAVLYGEGGHFCAGADLKAFAAGNGNRVAADGDGPLGPTRMRLNKPVVAAVAGYAVAGGLELALWCDLRVAEESAVFGVFCRRFGVPLVDGGTVRLPDLIGLSRALDMILTGRPVAADEALSFGLVNRVVADGESRDAAEALALELASFPQICMLNDRRNAYDSRGQAFSAAMASELELGLRTLATGEALEGAGRFRSGEGRHGIFEGDRVEDDPGVDDLDQTGD